MRLQFLFSIVLISAIGFAQNNFFIPLDFNSFYTINSEIYVNHVIDKRDITTNVGSVKVGMKREVYNAQILEGFTRALETYYRVSIKTSTDQEPRTVAIRKFEVSEKYYGMEQTAIVDIVLEYMKGQEVIFRDTIHNELLTSSVTKMHGYNIAEALSISIGNYHLSQFGRRTSAAASKKKHSNRNITAIGYQIGGLNLIGIDQEFRLNDVLGIHIGGGIVGFTLGTKFHFTDQKKGSFINISYKGGGMESIRTFAVEYGGHYSFTKEGNFGPHYQIGLSKITKIDPVFADLLFKGNPTPKVILSFGLGFSW